MHLFLEGAPRTGKSTILRNVLLPYQQAAAGFMVQRLFENGQMCGFRACVLNGGALPALEAAYSGETDGVFLHGGKAVPGVLEDAVARAKSLCERESCKLILLDEIGGFELFSPAFMQPLDAVLRLGKPCLGVIKARENLAHTARRLHLPDEILRQNENLRRQIEENGRVLAVTGGNLAGVTQTVADFVRIALFQM